MTEPSASPFPQIGLSANFTPGPVGWAFAKVDANAGAGPVTLHIILIDTVAGRIGIALDRAAMLRFADQIREQAGGLTIVDTLPPSNGQH